MKVRSWSRRWREIREVGGRIVGRRMVGGGGSGGRTLGWRKVVFNYVCSCESPYVRCLMLLNCFHTRTMLEIESRCVFRLMWAIMWESV